MGGLPKGTEEELEPLHGRHASSPGSSQSSGWGALLEHAKAAPMGLGYIVCSSLMMVCNKLAVQNFPFPSMLMAIQFMSAALVVRLLALCGQLDAAPLRWSKVREFWVVPFVFEIAIYTNIKLLQATSVETAIVFRTLVPIITSWADWAFMGRALPSLQSASGLLLIILGAVGYAISSRAGIQVNTWLWAMAYLVILAFEMVYVKYILNSLPMSTWTRVYYNNILALLFCPPFLFIGSEYSQVGLALATTLLLWQVGLALATISQPRPLCAVCASCVLGVGISFTGFGFRNLVTATTFTVVGVMNKILTVLVSTFMFASDVSVMSAAALLACIGGGTMYRQAPMRPEMHEGLLPS